MIAARDAEIGELTARVERLDPAAATTAPPQKLGPILVGALARLEGDTAAYRQALVAFRSRADTELARTDRPEYVEHQQLLAEIRQAAETQ